MKHRRALVGLFGVFALMSATAVSPAVAAECAWAAEDLPLPAGATYSWAEGSSEDNRFVVGSYLRDKALGAVWDNGVFREMAPPPPNTSSVWPRAVNNNGVIAGILEFREGGTFSRRAFRYENGTYTLLARTPTSGPGEQSQALGINERGDIIGQAWQKSAPNARKIVLWQKFELRRTIGEGYPAGITDEKIVYTTPGTAWVVDRTTGTRTELPGAQQSMVVDDDRVLHSASDGSGNTRLNEWSLDGRLVGFHRDGIFPFGRNAAGTVFGTATPEPSGGSLWRNGTRTDLVAAKKPLAGYYGDITDENVLIGTYRNADHSERAARWYCR